MRDPERARAALKDVKRLGVSIALDKFGSGQYSLGLPSNLPLDVVKLDRILIGSFDRDKERRAMFAATIALAKEAGLDGGRRGHRDQPPARPRARARLLGRAGLPAARPRLRRSAFASGTPSGR